MNRFLAVSALSFFANMALAQIPANIAWVRVVHGSSDAPAVDVLANGSVVFQGLKFKSFTEYTPVPSGTYEFKVNPTGTPVTVLNSGPLNLQGGTAYTFYAFGKAANNTLTLMGTGDDVAAPGMGQAKIRIVHGASTAPSVDVWATTPYAPLTGAPALTGVPFALASDFLTIPAGVYHARVTPTGTKTVAIDSGRFALMGNTVRTVVALDPSTSGGAFELLVLPDVN